MVPREGIEAVNIYRTVHGLKGLIVRVEDRTLLYPLDWY